jgi:hypothetical protein
MCVGIKVVVGVSGKPPSQEQTLIKKRGMGVQKNMWKKSH